MNPAESRLGSQIAIRLPDDVVTALGLLAQRRGRTRAEELREAVRCHLASAAQNETRPAARRGDVSDTTIRTSSRGAG